MSASLLITGEFRSTPQAAIYTLVCLSPLSLHLEGQVIRCALRLRELRQWRSQSFGHFATLCRVKFIREEIKTSDYISPRLNFEQLDFQIFYRDIWIRNNPFLCGITVYADILTGPVTIYGDPLAALNSLTIKSTAVLACRKALEYTGLSIKLY